VSGAPEVYGELPINLLAEEITTPGPGQVRALISVASNVALSTPGGTALAEALDQLEFMVSLDIYLNETSRHADVILPGLSPLEEAHYDVVFPQFSYRNHARYSGPVFPQPEGQVPEWQHLMRLASLLGGAAESPWVGPEQWVDLALRAGPYRAADGVSPLTLGDVQAAPGGIDLGPLQPRLPELLRTPSGRIELAPSACLADLAEALTDRPSADEFQVIGRREVRSNNSWMHNLPVLSKGRERCTVQIHPQDAARLGVREGDAVELRRGDATVSAPAEVTTAVMPGVVSLPHGWGHDQVGACLSVAAARPGANLNALMDPQRRDPLSGTAVLSGQPVTLKRLPEPIATL
jgi:anaerobic selenocysteine-containing dehydrogenase